jgi:hypothetical protein
VSTAHGVSEEVQSTLIPPGTVFKTEKPFKFHLFNFHRYFDILLGMDNLKLLESKIDLARDELITPKVKFNLSFKDTNKEMESHNIRANN